MGVQRYTRFGNVSNSLDIIMPPIGCHLNVEKTLTLSFTNFIVISKHTTLAALACNYFLLLYIDNLCIVDIEAVQEDQSVPIVLTFLCF
jgi:hypothetical protein